MRRYTLQNLPNIPLLVETKVAAKRRKTSSLTRVLSSSFREIKKNYLTFKRKLNSHQTKKKLLIVVEVNMCPRPIRLLVNDNDLVSRVIQMILKSYAPQGRLPRVGLDPKDFVLLCKKTYCGLNPTEAIGCCGRREFILCKKETNVVPDTLEKEIFREWKLLVSHF